MSDEKFPQNPNDAKELRSALPRIEVEPTPTSPESEQEHAAAGARTASTPRLEPVEGIPVTGRPVTDEAVREAYTAERQPAPYAYAQPEDANEGSQTFAHAAHDAQSGGPVPPAGAHAAPASQAQAPVVTEKHTVVKTRAKKMPVFLASLLGLVAGAALVIALVMSGAFRVDSEGAAPAATQSAGSTTKIDIDPEDTTLAEAVASKALPSVISITVETRDGGGIGSGVILDTEGHALTNYHVVQGAQGISVKLNNGENYEAEVVGTDESSDLAVIKIDASADVLTPIEVADSDELNVGEWVMAIGSPFGNEQSVSTGIVSALYRSTALPSSTGTSIYANMIQTDAAINPGNSGGALVNDEGKLIGINSIIESESGSSAGVGFAIPSNYAIDIANQIIDGKTPVHAYLGATLTTVNAYNARMNNLAVSTGAYVVEVAADGPADKAGLKQGDIITAVDGDPVDSADSLIILIREHEVDDKVTLSVNRDGKDEKLEVTLGSDEALQAEQQDSAEGDNPGDSMSEEDFYNYLEQFLNSQGY